MNDQQVSFIGQQLAERYQIERQIGQGNVGTVYRVDDQRTPRTVAMKVFNSEVVPDSAAARALLADARLVTQLVSPNLLPTLDVGVHADRFAFIVEPLLAGKSLAQRFDEQGPLPVAQAVRVAIELLSALEVLHRADILHLDIKPANVFLIADPLGMERAVLGGIGTWHVLGLDQAPAKAKGVCLAQPEYIAPEIVSGKPLTRQTDIYQIGVLLYEMLTGRPPFPGSNFKATARRHALEKPVSPKLVRPQARIPDDLDQVVMQCLEKNAKRRFDNPTALARALETIAQSGFAAGDGQFRRTGGPTEAEAERPDPDELAQAARAADAAKRATESEAARLAAEAAHAVAAQQAAEDAKKAADAAAALDAENAKAAAKAENTKAEAAKTAKQAAQAAAEAEAAKTAERAAKAAAEAEAAKVTDAQKADAARRAAEEAKKADQEKTAAEEAKKANAAKKTADAAKKTADAAKKTADAAKKAVDAEAAKTVVDIKAIDLDAGRTAEDTKAVDAAQATPSSNAQAGSRKKRRNNKKTRGKNRNTGSNKTPAPRPGSSTQPEKTSVTVETKTEPAKTDAAKTEPAKTDAAKTDAAKTDAAKTDAAKTDAAKTDAAKTDAAKTDAAKTQKAPAAAAFGANAPTARGQLDLSSAPPAAKAPKSSSGRATSAALSGDEGWFVDSTAELEEKHAKLSVYHFQEEEERSLLPFIIAAVVAVVGIIFLIVSIASDDTDSDPGTAATDPPASRSAVPATTAAKATAPASLTPQPGAPDTTPGSAAPSSGAAMPSTSAREGKAKRAALIAQGESAVTAARWSDVVAASKALRTMNASTEADALTRKGLRSLLKTGAAQLKAESLPDALATAKTALTLAPADRAAQRLKSDVEAAQKALIAKAGADAVAAAALEAKRLEDERRAQADRAAAEAKAAADAADAARKAEDATAAKASRAAEASAKKAEAKQAASAKKAEAKQAASAKKAEAKQAAAAKKAEAKQAAAAKKAERALAARARKAASARKRAEAKKVAAAKKAASADARKAAAATRAANRATAAGVIKRGKSQMAAGQWAAAQKSFLEATRIDSGSAVAFAGLSEVAFQQQKFNEAVKFGKRAVRLSSRNANYRVQLGLSYFKLKQYAAAKKEWDSAVKIKPGHPAATKYLKIVKKRLGG